jgi:single-stranded DNA-binding protein
MSGIECAFFGALGRDAELKTSKNGKSYLRLNVRTGDGDSAQWVSAMVFDPEAVSLASKFIKGVRVYIEGSMKLDAWTGQDGKERHGLSVMSWHARLAAIGKNKSSKPVAVTDTSVASQSTEPRDRQVRVRGTADSELNDEVPF